MSRALIHATGSPFALCINKEHLGWFPSLDQGQLGQSDGEKVHDTTHLAIRSTAQGRGQLALEAQTNGLPTYVTYGVRQAQAWARCIVPGVVYMTEDRVLSCFLAIQSCATPAFCLLGAHAPAVPGSGSSPLCYSVDDYPLHIDSKSTCVCTTVVSTAPGAKASEDCW